MELTRTCIAPSPILQSSKDFNLYKDITFRPIFKFKDSEGDPLSLVTTVITFYIVSGNGENILTISSTTITPNGSTIVLVDEIGGIIEVLITDEETSELDFKEANWWITLTLLNGDVVLRGKGIITLSEIYN